MDAPNTLTRHYKVMFHWLTLLGLQWNGMEKILCKNRILYFIVRHFYILVWGVVLLFAVDIHLFFLKLVVTGKFTYAMAPVVINCFGLVMTFYRLWIIKFKGKEILEVFIELDQILLNRARNKKMISLVIKNRVFINSLTIYSSIISSCSSTYFFIRNALRLGRSSMPSTFEFLDDGVFLVMFQLLAAYTSPIVMAGFTFTVGPAVSTLANEMAVLQDDLADIFDAVQADPLGNIVINKKVIDENDAENAKRLKAQKFQECDRRLSAWIDCHARVVECTKKISYIVRWAVLMFYAYTVVLATSLIFTSLKGRHPLSLVIFNALSYGTLYAICYMGQQLINESSSVATAALGKCYFLYPTHMQKALKLIVLMSQKPLNVNIMGLYPLSLETLFAVTNLCYSIISFLAGFSINVD